MQSPASLVGRQRKASSARETTSRVRLRLRELAIPSLERPVKQRLDGRCGQHTRGFPLLTVKRRKRRADVEPEALLKVLVSQERQEGCLLGRYRVRAFVEATTDERDRVQRVEAPDGDEHHVSLLLHTARMCAMAAFAARKSSVRSVMSPSGIRSSITYNAATVGPKSGALTPAKSRALRPLPRLLLRPGRVAEHPVEDRNDFPRGDGSHRRMFSLGRLRGDAI